MKWPWSQPDFNFEKEKNHALEIVKAEDEGRRAWKILVVNAMLAEQFLRKKPWYHWTERELAQLADVPLESLKMGRSSHDSSDL